MNQRVVIVVLDGARVEETIGDGSADGGWSDAADGLTLDIMPLLNSELVPAGALTAGYGTGVTATVPAHADLLAGARISLASLPMQDGVAAYRPDLPLLTEQLRRQHGLDQEHVVVSANTEFMNTITYSLYPGLGEEFGATFSYILDPTNSAQPASNDEPVLQDVQRQLEQGARFVLANLHQIDRDGHYNPEHYSKAISEVDLPLASLWRWIQSEESGMADETLLVIMADHGRHRLDDEFPWQHHGCHCAGCRQVPILLLGPGVEAGVRASEPHTLLDVSRTVAWLMGIDMPYASGRVMTDLLTGAPEADDRAGQVRVHASGELRAYQEWAPSFARRSSIVVDGEPFDDSDALHVEEPRVLRSGARDFVCWRRLAVTEGASIWPWEPRCMTRSGADWQDMASPKPAVWPGFSPTMIGDGVGGLAMAFTEAFVSTEPLLNTHEMASMSLLRWSEAHGWETFPDALALSIYPTDPSLVSWDGALWLAVAVGNDAQECRYTRHIAVTRIDWGSDGQRELSEAYRSSAHDSRGRELERMERPALQVSDDRLHLAFQAYIEGGVSVITTYTDRGAAQWAPQRPADTSVRVMGHIRPQWSDDGLLYWARLGPDDELEICRVAAEETDEDCRVVDGVALDSLSPSADGAWVSVGDEHGTWELREVRW